ncbi:MAG TPA: SWIM zinc finger family protein [Streptomyces sp.]|nr:SWIM zinc finger family protein [Streptomyces sp.]
MTGVGVRLTAEEVLTLAPDEASRRAGSKLARPGRWSDAGSGPDAVWGLCMGSDSAKPYRTVVDLEGAGEGRGPGFKCSCPSRKFPCKHVLGLLLLWAGEQARPDGNAPPGWAEEWLSARRERAGRKAAEGESASRRSEGAGRRSADPEAARRRAERRMQRITAGATELEERLSDLLRGGLAGADQLGGATWGEMAARMVDAQAPGLASRIRELDALPTSGAWGSPQAAGSGRGSPHAAGSGRGSPQAGGSGGRAERLLSECALLHLLNRGFLTLDSLPDPLAATVRTRVGLTVDSAELLAGEAGGEEVRDDWLVLAQRDTEEGRLTARRIWLHGSKSGRPALLLSYAPAGRGLEVALTEGSVLDAELSYYPGARPLRAALGERHGAWDTGHVPAGGTVTDALKEYATALCGDPWLDAWPVVLEAVVPIAGDGGEVSQLADAEGEFALPVAPGASPTALWKLLAVAGGGPVTVFGECGHRGFAPYTVWSGAEAVPL